LKSGGAVFLAFRMAAVQGWRISRATLLLRVESGASPEALKIAPLADPWSESEATSPATPPAGKRRPARPYERDWIAVELDPADLGSAGLAISGAEVRFGARESVGHAPYLLVEGSTIQRQ
jgi:hypothetical protein